MSRRQESEKDSQWRDLVGRQAKSGLSVRQFCERERISQPSFYAWRRRLREAEGTATRSPVTPRDTDASKASEFIPLRLLDTPVAWEVIHPCGCRVRVSSEVNATALECILRVLDERVQR